MSFVQGYLLSGIIRVCYSESWQNVANKFLIFPLPFLNLLYIVLIDFTQSFYTLELVPHSFFLIFHAILSNPFNSTSLPPSSLLWHIQDSSAHTFSVSFENTFYFFVIHKLQTSFVIIIIAFLMFIKDTVDNRTNYRPRALRWGPLTIWLEAILSD
jgi:hypothetical protein